MSYRLINDAPIRRELMRRGVSAERELFQLRALFAVSFAASRAGARRERLTIQERIALQRGPRLARAIAEAEKTIANIGDALVVRRGRLNWQEVRHV